MESAGSQQQHEVPQGMSGSEVGDVTAVGDAAAAVKHTDPNAETSELLSLRLFGYLLVAINLSSTFAYKCFRYRTRHDAIIGAASFAARH